MHAISLGHLDSCPLWLGLEPGRKFALPLGLIFCYTEIYEEVNKGNTEKETRPTGNRSSTARYLKDAGRTDCRSGNLGHSKRCQSFRGFPPACGDRAVENQAIPAPAGALNRQAVRCSRC